jgi:hypothetical protein
MSGEKPRDIGKEFREAIRPWATWTTTLRALCESCNNEDIKRIMDYAVAYKETKELKELNVSQPAYYEVVKEVIKERRHREVMKDSLIVIGTLIIAVATFIVCLLAWLFPRSPVADASTRPCVSNLQSLLQKSNARVATHGLSPSFPATHGPLSPTNLAKNTEAS